jgi:hypothetical protein
MKRGKTYTWIPLWIDKWLWGSTRHELAHDERAIFTDLLALAAKDDGWIRANPETPYPVEQLAGMLCASIELLSRTISKCKEFGKIEEPIPGIYRIASWEGYQLTDRRKRDLAPISEKEEAVSEKTDTFSVSVSPKFSSFLTIKEKWNRFAGDVGLPTIRDIAKGSARDRALNARMSEQGFDFDELLAAVAASPFLLGKVKGRDFKASFDWIIAPSNYQKIIEGNYRGSTPLDGPAAWLKEQEEKDAAK